MNNYEKLSKEKSIQILKGRERKRSISMKDRIREEENNSNTKGRIREVKKKR